MGEEEYGKLARYIKKAFLNKKEEFCKADYLSLQAAKAQLMTLVTEIRMDEAGFIINENLEDCKKQTDLLKIEKDHLNQYQYNIDIRMSENMDTFKARLDKHWENIPIRYDFKMQLSHINTRRDIDSETGPQDV